MVVFPAESSAGSGWLENSCAALRALRHEGAEKIPAVLVLPPQATLLKHVRTPRVSARKRAQIVTFEAGQNIPCELNEVVWDSVLSGEGKTTQDVLLVAAKLDLIMPLCAAAQASGFAVQRIVPEALAVLALCRMVLPKRDEPELLLALAPNAVSLLLLAGRDFAARSLQCGGIGTALPEKWAERLAAEVTRSVLHFQRQCGLQDPTRVRLVGDVARQPALAPALAEQLGLPVQALDVGGMAGVDLQADGSGAPRGWAELIGAAALVSVPGQATVNLLPPGLRTQQRRRRRQPWLLAAALLALAAPVGPWLHLHQLAQTAETGLTEVEAELAPLRARDAVNRNNLARLAELERQIAAWQAVQARRTAWLQGLSDMQERLAGVEDVWLERMRILPATKDAPLKLVVAGRMWERGTPAARSGPQIPDRVKALLSSLAESPFVAAVESERFDGTQAGLLAFEFVIVTEEARPL